MKTHIFNTILNFTSLFKSNLILETYFQLLFSTLIKIFDLSQEN